MEEFFEALGLRQQLPELLKSNPELAHELETMFGREGKFSPSKEAICLQAETFYDDSDKTRGDIHLRLLQYEEKKACYEQALAMQQALFEGNHL